jgi:CRP-like cAMP-binding protein
MSVSRNAARLAALRGVGLFGRLDRRTIQELNNRAREHPFAAGAVLVQQGEPGDSLCILLEGRAEVRLQGRTIDAIGPGDYFGEMSLVDGEPRSATIVATEDGLLLCIAASDFDALLNLPYVAREVIRCLSARVRELHGKTT